VIVHFFLLCIIIVLYVGADMCLEKQQYMEHLQCISIFRCCGRLIANAIQPGSNQLQIQQSALQKEARGPGIRENFDSSDLRQSDLREEAKHRR